MNFRLRRHQPPDEELRRTVVAELEVARKKLEGAYHNAAALHEARKTLKRLRALLDLARPYWGPVARTETRCLRNVGRKLARHREIDALAAVLRSEAREAGIRRVADLLGALRLHQMASTAAVDRHRDLASARRILDQVGQRLEQQSGASVAKAEVWNRFRKSYRRARRAYQKAATSLGVDAMHEWRKAAKMLLNQVRVLETWGTVHVRGLRRELSELDSLLSRSRDCEILAGILRGVPAMEEPRRGRRGLRVRLQAIATAETARAIRRGRAVFRLKPKAFLRRMAA